MSKLRKRLSKWFLDTAKKLDKETVSSEMITLPKLDTHPITVYDIHHVDKIRGQYSISPMEMRMQKKFEGFNFENEIYYRIGQGITEQIMQLYGDQIDIEYRPDLDTQVYSLDVYVCKPQKKERL
jgi:hypothetical protein